MIFLSAGHGGPKTNYDPGAPGVNGRWEATETQKARNRISEIIRTKYNLSVINDLDTETRSEYFNRIKTGSGSVVCELHFNAGPPDATGTEMLVEVDADRLDKLAALKMAQATGSILGINLRSGGVKSEADTRHKRLGLMREEGIVILAEICFISNASDMQKYDENFEKLCQAYAELLVEFESWVV